LTAVALTSCPRVTFAYEGADPSRGKTGEQDRQENYRSCGSSRHFRKLYLRLHETRKPAQGLSSIEFPSTEPRKKVRGNNSEAI